MKAPTLMLGWAATAHALMLPQLGIQQQALLNAEVHDTQEQYLIETAPGDTQWVTEDNKWELRRQGINFMDITETSDLGISTWTHSEKAAVEFPKHPAQNKSIRAILGDVEESKMRENLEIFTAFHTRYYKSSYGEESSKWLLGRVHDTIAASDAAKHGATVEAFAHPWQQSSVIARIPGRSNKTIVIGAHQDSINLFLPSILAAPGADDDGSGSVTILEALRVLLQDHDLSHGKAPNTLEFHWYSAEEGGLLGSQAIFSSYEKAGRDVRAMFHQDMTGYVAKTLEAGEPESFGVITDYVDAGLTDFIKKCIDAYCDIPYVLTRCGYACSDHASATKAGYPSAFVIESDFKYSDKKIHTTEDKIEYLSFSHMRQHAMLTLSLAYELTFHEF